MRRTLGGDRTDHAVAGSFEFGMRSMTYEISTKCAPNERHENVVAAARKPYRAPLVAKGPALAAVTAGIATVSALSAT